MKKILLLVIGFCMVAGTNVTHATSISKTVDPIFSEALMLMRAADFVKLTIKDFTKLSQKKLTLKEKISFSVLKKNLRRELKKNPNLTVGDYMQAAGNKRMSTWAWVGIIASVLLLIFVIIGSSINFN